MDTKVNFTVKALGFPTGKIYKMYIWMEGYVENAGKHIDNNVDDIKEQLKNTCVVHAIEFTHSTYTNMVHDGEDYGDIILEKEVSISKNAGKKKKEKKKKIEIKPITDISKIDLPNIDDDDLNRLRIRTINEIFKRKHKLSDDVFSFFIKNQDKITVEEAKQICEEHGSVDLYLLEKRAVRKKVEEKILSN